MPRRRSIATSETSTPHLAEITSRKVDGALVPFAGVAPDTVESLSAWITRYLTLAVVGVRSEEVADKIALHLERFRTFYTEAYGHERVGMSSNGTSWPGNAPCPMRVSPQRRSTITWLRSPAS